MAQLAGALRISFTSVRIERTGGMFAWARQTRDQDIWLDWRADVPAEGQGQAAGSVLAEGRVTAAEVRWWHKWFTQAGEVRRLGAKLGTAPTDPVARLWTPLAGQAVEFFVWPEATGGLVLLALFVPDPASPYRRVAVEVSVTDDELAAFGAALNAEADRMAAQASAEGPQG